MFKLIVALALLPFAIATVLTILGFAILAWPVLWRIGLTVIIGAVWLLLGAAHPEDSGWIFVGALLAFGWVWQGLSKSPDVRPVSPASQPMTWDAATVEAYMKAKGRFTVRDIQKAFNFDSMDTAGSIVLAAAQEGIVTHKHPLSLYWYYSKTEESQVQANA